MSPTREETSKQRAEPYTPGSDREHAVTGEHGLGRLGKSAKSLLALGALIAGVCGALGYRIIGPKQDAATATERIESVKSTLSERVDSVDGRVRRVIARQDTLIVTVADMRSEMELQSYIQCVVLRRTAPDLLPKGCVDVERRAKR